MQFGIDQKGIYRFLRYTSVGVGTFAFDLLLLHLFIDVQGVNYLVATALAFVIAVSINFALSRAVAFRETIRSVPVSYVSFLAIGVAALATIMFSMYLAVDILELDYFISRILVATLVGFCNYLVNLYSTFDVAGKHG